MWWTRPQSGWLASLFSGVRKSEAKRSFNGQSVRRKRAKGRGWRPLLEVLEARLAPAVISWTGNSGLADASWHTAANWDLARVPTTGDDVVISDVTATNSIAYSTGATSVRSLVSSERVSIVNGGLTLTGPSPTSDFNAPLTLAGGTLNGSYSVHDGMTWTGGALGAGIITVAGTATLNISGAATKTIGVSANLVNLGIVNWIGGQINTSSGSIISNQAQFNMRTDARIAGASGAPRFDNNGTITRDTAGGVAELNISLNNTAGGVININSGTLKATVGGFWTGAGTINATGGVFEHAGGTITGAGDMTVHGAMNWTGGALGGTGKTIIASDAKLNIIGMSAGNGGFTGRTVDNFGTATIVAGNNGRLDWSNGSIFNNKPGALFDAQADREFLQFTGAVSTFNNEGSYRKSAGAGRQRFSGIAFNNSGTVDARTGILEIRTGNSNGRFVATDPGIFEFGQGTHILGTGAILEGPGLIRTAANGANLDIAGTVVAALGSIVNLGTGVSGGDLFGTGNFIVHGALNWTVGNMRGTGSTLFAPSARVTIFGRSSGGIDQRTINNMGTVALAGAGRLDITNGGVFNNLNGAIFDAQTNVQLLRVSGTGTFSNDGLYKKSAGTGTSQFAAVDLHNAGTVEIQSGTLQVTGTYAQTAGTTKLNGGNLSVSVPLALNGGTLEGTGTITGSVNNSGGIVAPGFSPGQLTITGSYTQGANAKYTAQIGGTAPGVGFDKLTISGAATLNGTLDVDVIDDFAPLDGSVFQIMSFGSRSGQFTQFLGLEIRAHEAFQLTHNATSVSLTATSAADLRVDSVTVSPGELTAGENVSVTWTVSNQGNATTAGSWTDSIFLSTDSVFDPGDKLIGRAFHVGDLAHLGTYTGSLTAPLPFMTPTAYHAIVIADSRAEVADVDVLNNTRSSSPTPFDVPLLHLGVPVNVLVPAGQRKLFRVQLPPGGNDVRIKAQGAQPGALEIRVNYRDVPTAADTDYSGYNVGSELQNILIPFPQAGDYFIELRSRSAIAETSEILCEQIPFALTEISQTRGSNAGQVTMTLVGSGFSPESTSALIDDAGAVYSAITTVFVDEHTLYATYDLAGLATGLYDMCVNDLNHAEPACLTDAFTVTSGNPGRVVGKLTTPSDIRAGRTGVATFDYSNAGDTDVIAPLYEILAINGEVRLDPNGSFVSRLPVLGIHSQGMAGVLPPGAKETLKIEFRATGSSPVEIRIVEIVDSDTVVDWSALNLAGLAAGIPPELWNVFFLDRLNEEAGTQAKFHAKLIELANYLSGLGENTGNVAELTTFLIRIIDNFGELSMRWRVGAMGHGVSDPTNYRATQDASGNVSIETRDRIRFFMKRADGSYKGSGADGARVRKLVDDGFELLEPDNSRFVFFPEHAEHPKENLNFFEDRNGNRITAQYIDGNMVGTLDSFADFEQYVYTGAKLTRVINAVGDITDYAYTGEHVTSMTTSLGTTTFEYYLGEGVEKEHALKSVTGTNGVTTYFNYNEKGWLAETFLNDQLLKHIRAFGSGALLELRQAGIDGANQLFRNRFGQVVRWIDPLHNVLSQKFDKNQLPSEAVVPGNTKVSWTFDNNGNTTQRIGAIGEVSTVTYHPENDQPSQFTDPNKNNTHYSYSISGDLTGIRYANNTSVQIGVNSQGFETSYLNARNQFMSFDVDANGKTTSMILPDGTRVNYSHDGRRLIEETSDSLGNRVRNFYDDAGHLTRQELANHNDVFGQNRSGVNMTYDAQGRVESAVDDFGFGERYERDELGRIIRVFRVPTNRLIEIRTYDAAGRLIREDHVNFVEIHTYDDANNRTSTTIQRPGGAILESYVFTFDGLGRQTSMITSLGATTYTWNGANLVTNVGHADGRVDEIDYYLSGNVKTVNGTNVGITERNNVKDVGGDRIIRDLDENAIEYVRNNGTTVANNYNALNVLQSSTGPGQTITFLNDATGNNYGITRNGVPTFYLRNPITGSVMGQFNESLEVIARNTFVSGQLVDSEGPAGQRSYVTDPFNNVNYVLDGNGDVLNQYLYDARTQELYSSSETELNEYKSQGGAGATTEANGVVGGDGKSYVDQSNTFWGALNFGGFVDPGALNGKYHLSSETDENGVNGSVSVETLSAVQLLGASMANALAYGGQPLPAYVAEKNLALQEQWLAMILGQYSEDASQVQELIDVHFHWDEVRARKQAAREEAFAEFKKQYVAPLLGAQTTLADAANAGSAVERAKSEKESIERFVTGQGLGDQLDRAPSGLAAKGTTSIVDSVALDDGMTKALSDLFETMSFFGFHIVGTGLVSVRRAKDPNDIVGPTGFGLDSFLTGDGTLPYQINFENLATASAPAQEIVITQQLDTDLDLNTFELGNMGFGSTTIAVPAGLDTFSTRIDLTATDGIFVDVDASLDFLTGVATWHFIAVEPTTGDLPFDPLAGFLPPDVIDGKGEGFVTYSIRANPGLATGTRLDAIATIIFDVEAPLDTLAIFNTIDAAPPDSSVAPLPAVTDTTTFTVSWSGADDPGGSGIAAFDVFVSLDGGPSQPLLQGTSSTSTAFTGEDGHRYGFFSIATDNVGRQQPTTGEQAFTVVRLNKPPVARDDSATTGEETPVTIDVLANDDDPDGHSLTVVSVTAPAHGDVIINDDFTLTYTPAIGFQAVDAFEYTISDGHGGTASAVVSITVVNLPPIVNAGDDQIVNEGDRVSLHGTFTDPGSADTHTFRWQVSADNGQVIAGGEQEFSFIPNDNGAYTAVFTATDNDGASGFDSVVITVLNVAPTTAISGAPVSSPEGTAISLTAGATDPSSADTHTFAWSVTKDGAAYAAGAGVGFSFTPDDNGSYVVTLTAADDDGGADSDTKTIEVVNVVPAVNAGPDGTTAAGSNFVSSGFFVDPGADTWIARVDYGDGSGLQTLLFDPDNSFVLNHTYVGAGSFSISVTIIDNDGGSGSDSATVTVTPVVSNSAPIITALQSSSPDCGGAAEGQIISVWGHFTDADRFDSHSAVINWGDGVETAGVINESIGLGTISGQHIYVDGGIYSITVTLVDDRGLSDREQAGAVIAGAGVQNGVLHIIGTNRDDHVTVNKQGNGLYKVHADFFANANSKTFSTQGIERIVALLCAGNDEANLAGNITIPALINGGAGADQLNGGTGPAVLVGGDGDDKLNGGSGATLLIGGNGEDRLVGGNNDDLLIGGSTAFDDNRDALLALLAEWSSGRDYATRIANLRGTGSGTYFDQRLNGNYYLKGSTPARTVFDDGAKDKLTGTAGRDWFFANLDGGILDVLTDRHNSELVDEC